MRADQILSGEIATLELRPELVAEFGPLPERSEASLLLGEGGTALLQIGGRQWAVSGKESRDESLLRRIGERNLPRVCWVAGAQPSAAAASSVLLQIHSFPSQLIWVAAVDIGVDEKIVEEVRRRLPGLSDVGAVVAWLSEQVLLPPGDAEGKPRALILGRPQGGQLRAFRLIGNGIAVDAELAPDDRIRIRRVVEAYRSRRGDERRPVLLVEGPIRFCDATLAAQFRGGARSQLDELVARSGSYLRMWREYNELERDAILRHAQSIGVLKYTERRPIEGGWRFKLVNDEKIDALLGQIERDGDVNLEAGEEPPSELINGKASPKSNRSVYVGRWVRTGRGSTLDLRTLDELAPHPPERGVLFHSLRGDLKRLERRDDAATRIATGECSMPQLILLIEDAPVPSRRVGAEVALTAASRLIFGGEPTDRQRTALKIALNTPDIALIQGPPGTGKTRTIAALQTRLAEITEADSSVTGQTLLTSFQHDAVENAAQKTNVFGLPALKLGRRNDEPDALAEPNAVERWRRDRIEALQAELATLPPSPQGEVVRAVRDLAVRYLLAGRDRDEAVQTLREVAERTRGRLSQALQERLAALRQVLANPTATLPAEGEREPVRRAIRGLRTTPESFVDDGPVSAYKALRRLADILTPEERELLQRAADWTAEHAPPFVPELARLRERLEEQTAAPPTAEGAPTVLADVASLLGEIVDHLCRELRASCAGESDVLDALVHDLEHDPFGVRDAVQHYTAVLAATCQQAVASSMRLAKEDGLVFENVVVDEAARANPLDLFIPMALARRRIILVGDHRQLPHILEPDVESQLEHAVSEGTREALKRSLFERLFIQLQNREAQDHVKRTVTLDVQYRMHPQLGDFVSRTFYEFHSPSEKFRSGEGTERLLHGLPQFTQGGVERVAAWKRIPLSDGIETKGRSKSRRAEARWIAAEVQKLTAARSDLSIGVISFYAAQIDVLLGEFEHRGLCERDDDGRLRLRAEYREQKDSRGERRDRLRIGTVDAFQGKEFDVVFLSMTRANDYPVTDEQALRRKYGHLMLENRLCVAMSRQRRLLIVVGDDNMLAPAEAQTAVRGLCAFRAMCEGSHGMVL
ncbi:MAG: AAA domain-containing protein [Polyangia bacterium]